MGKIKHKNKKIKLVYLGKLVKKAGKKGEFVEIDDPDYEMDDLLGCC